MGCFFTGGGVFFTDACALIVVDLQVVSSIVKTIIYKKTYHQGLKNTSRAPVLVVCRRKGPAGSFLWAVGSLYGQWAFVCALIVIVDL